MLDSKIPPGPIEEKWERSRFEMKLVNPANRRKHTVIMVGSGLAGVMQFAALVRTQKEERQTQCAIRQGAVNPPITNSSS